MQLRVTKPGFMRGIDALARSAEPVPHLPSIEKWRKGDRSAPYDPNRDASRQELRSMVCGQCHVTYYCGPKATLFFPWAHGLKVEEMEATFDAYKFPDGHRFFDWKHARTGAEVIKAKHPEFELWSQGIHARSGVSCADCHMPYLREGAIKISDHQVRSPLLNLSRACQTCHRFPEAELKARVEAIQDRTHALLDRAEDALVQLIGDLAEGQGGRRAGSRAGARVRTAAQGPVARRLHQRRELHGLPRAPGGGSGAGRSDRLRPPGPAGAARHPGPAAARGRQAVARTPRRGPGSRDPGPPAVSGRGKNQPAAWMDQAIRPSGKFPALQYRNRLYYCSVQPRWNPIKFMIF